KVDSLRLAFVQDAEVAPHQIADEFALFVGYRDGHNDFVASGGELNHRLVRLRGGLRWRLRGLLGNSQGAEQESAEDQSGDTTLEGHDSFPTILPRPKAGFGFSVVYL